MELEELFKLRDALQDMYGPNVSLHFTGGWAGRFDITQSIDDRQLYGQPSQETFRSRLLLKWTFKDSLERLLSLNREQLEREVFNQSYIPNFNRID